MLKFFHDSTLPVVMCATTDADGNIAVITNDERIMLLPIEQQKHLVNNLLAANHALGPVGSLRLEVV